MANGKRKGNKNERELTKWFQEWTGLEFQRVPQSGGLRWGNRDNIVGDIICTDERKGRNFPFTIETKFHKDINFQHLLLEVKGNKILEFWDQAKSDGEATGKIPLLFMRINGMAKQTWFVGLDADLFNKHFIKYLKPEYTILTFKKPGYNLVFMRSQELINFPIDKIIKKIKLAGWKRKRQ